MSKRGKMILSSRLGKRGISPLIATVLLIAFAVSIGTMIMNWGKDAIAVGDCTETRIDVQTYQGKQFFCYDTLAQQVKFTVTNTGSVDIVKLKMRIVSPDFSVIDVDIPESSFKAGDPLSKNVELIKAGMFRAELIPTVKIAGKDRICSEKMVFIDDIPKCE